MLPHDVQDPVEFSVVIPAYNEASRILPYLRAITSYMHDRRSVCEVIVIDDGSTDATASVVAKLAREIPVIHVIQQPSRRGKGAAVRRGMHVASGRLCLFADADGATPIHELARLEQAIDEGADLAIGSRTLASRMPDFVVQARLYRSILGSLFNSVVQRRGIKGIADTQCGFKLFRKTIAEDLFAVSSIDGYGFDLELLYVAQQRGYKIAEVPVNWSDQPGSKVRVLRDGFAMLGELKAIKHNEAKGYYRTSGMVDNFQVRSMKPSRLPSS